MDIKEAKEICKKEITRLCKEGKEEKSKAIMTVLRELNKKEVVAELMVSSFFNTDFSFCEALNEEYIKLYNDYKNRVLKYFTNKVEEDIKE